MKELLIFFLPIIIFVYKINCVHEDVTSFCRLILEITMLFDAVCLCVKNVVQ